MYILSLGVLGFLFYRIFFGVIPYSNKNRLIHFYQRLLNKGDFGKIMGYIEKYHEKKIIEYHSVFQKNKNFEEEEYEKADGVTQFRLMRGDIDYKSQIEYTNQQALAGYVYRWVVERDDFVMATANTFPYFYTEIFKHFKYKYPTNEEMIDWYFSTLLSNNNQFLKRELKSNVNLQEGQRNNYRFEHDNHILKSLLEDLDVAECTYAWKPFGEVAIQEIRSLEASHFLFKSYDSTVYPESRFLDLSTGKAIRFFDIMVCQTIYMKHGFHMWLPYYFHIASALVKKVDEIEYEEEYEVEDWGRDYPLNHLYLLYQMISNIYNWFHAMEDGLSAGHSGTVSKTMSGILLEIANSNSIGEKWKINQFDRIIRIYCEIFTAPLKDGHQEESRDINDAIVKSIEKVMIRPEYGSGEKVNAYHKIMKLAWKGFDRVPYEETTALEKLQENVFDKV
jgi:hypothetical protein